MKQYAPDYYLLLVVCYPRCGCNITLPIVWYCWCRTTPPWVATPCVISFDIFGCATTTSFYVNPYSRVFGILGCTTTPQWYAKVFQDRLIFQTVPLLHLWMQYHGLQHCMLSVAQLKFPLPPDLDPMSHSFHNHMTLIHCLTPKGFVCFELFLHLS